MSQFRGIFFLFRKSWNLLQIWLVFQLLSVYIHKDYKMCISFWTKQIFRSTTKSTSKHRNENEVNGSKEDEVHLVD